VNYRFGGKKRAADITSPLRFSFMSVVESLNSKI